MVTLRFNIKNSPTVITSDDEVNVEMNDFAKFDDNNNVLEKKEPSRHTYSRYEYHSQSSTHNFIAINVAAIKEDSKSNSSRSNSVSSYHSDTPLPGTPVLTEIETTNSNMLKPSNNNNRHERLKLLNPMVHDHSDSEVELTEFSDIEGSPKQLLINYKKKKHEFDIESIEDEENVSFKGSHLEITNFDDEVDENPVVSNPHSLATDVTSTVTESRNSTSEKVESLKTTPSAQSKLIHVQPQTEREVFEVNTFKSSSLEDVPEVQKPKPERVEELPDEDSAKPLEEETVEIEDEIKDKDNLDKENEGSLNEVHGNEQTENSQLLSTHNIDSATGDAETSPDHNSESVHSVFRGSLGIDVDVGTWECSIADQMDVRVGREQWATSFCDIVSESSVGDWETSLSEIAESKATEADWSTKLREIAKNDANEDTWSTYIAEKFINEETPQNWKTKFNSIEKVDPNKNRWTCVFKNIRRNVAKNGEWTTKFNSIAKNTKKRNEWTTKIPERLVFESKANDWNTKFNKLGSKNDKGESWTYRDRDLLITSDDRNTHWSTTFSDIEERNLNLEPWSTTFKKIEPRPPEEPWKTKFNELPKKYNHPEDWNVKFIDIEKVDQEKNQWSITMNDVPDSHKEESDWNTTFYSIANVRPEENPWNTKFNNILPNGDESEFWLSHILDMNVSDMTRETWQTDFRDILPNENTDLDWTVHVAPIEGVAE